MAHEVDHSKESLLDKTLMGVWKNTLTSASNNELIAAYGYLTSYLPELKKEVEKRKLKINDATEETTYISLYYAINLTDMNNDEVPQLFVSINKILTEYGDDTCRIRYHSHNMRYFSIYAPVSKLGTFTTWIEAFTLFRSGMFERWSQPIPIKKEVYIKAMDLTNMYTGTELTLVITNMRERLMNLCCNATIFTIHSYVNNNTGTLIKVTIIFDHEKDAIDKHQLLIRNPIKAGKFHLLVVPSFSYDL